MMTSIRSPLACLRALAAALGLVSATAGAAPVTALWYQGTTGALDSNVTRYFEAPAQTLAVTGTAEGLSVTAQAGQVGVRMDLYPPAGKTLVAGGYDNATSGFRNAFAQVSLYVQSVGCWRKGSRMNVLEAVYGPDNKVVSFAANFEHRCGPDAPPLYGELRFNSSIPFTSQEAPNSTVPDSFGFVARTQAIPGATVLSDETTIYGINAPALIGIAGGEYSVNGQPFTSAVGQVQNRDRVRVRTTASPAPGGLSRATLNVGGQLGVFDVVTYAPGEPINLLYLRSQPGDYYGGGTTTLLHGPEVAIELASTSNERDSASVAFRYLDGTFRVSLAGPTGKPLQPGVFEQTVTTYSRGGAPQMALYLFSRSCEGVGRFVVHEIEFGSSAWELARLAANFEIWCGGSPAPVFGEVRFNSTVPPTYFQTSTDSTPDPFALQAQSPVQAGAVVRSNWISVYGVNVPVPVSVTGGEYSLNGAPFTTSPGTAGELDDIVVRLIASSTPGATTQATLNVGDRSATLSATTYQPGSASTGMYVRSAPFEPVAQGKTALYLPPRNSVAILRGTENEIDVQLRGEADLTAQFGAPGRAQLEAGTFENAVQYWYEAPASPRLNVANGPRSCYYGLKGRFVVHEILYNPNGTVRRLAIDFEQSCGDSPPLYGEVRYDSAVPFSTLLGAACGPGDADGDGVPDCVELLEGRNPQVKDNDLFNNARLFAMQQYRDFLGREGESGGVGFWTTQLSGGTQTRAQMVETFFNSPEFQALGAPVVRLYFAYFLRVPDYGGLNYWTGRFRSGETLDAISTLFAQSPEFAARYGSLDNTGFVDRVYANILGRAPDAGGLAYWRAQLDAGMSRGRMMVEFSESAEYRSLIANEVYVTMLYVGMLRRSPDAGGFSAWVGYLDGGNPGPALIQRFLDAPEYRSRFLP